MINSNAYISHITSSQVSSTVHQIIILKISAWKFLLLTTLLPSLNQSPLSLSVCLFFSVSLIFSSFCYQIFPTGSQPLIPVPFYFLVVWLSIPLLWATLDLRSWQWRDLLCVFQVPIKRQVVEWKDHRLRCQNPWSSSSFLSLHSLICTMRVIICFAGCCEEYISWKFIEHLQFTMHYSKNRACIISFNPHNKSMR